MLNNAQEHCPAMLSNFKQYFCLKARRTKAVLRAVANSIRQLKINLKLHNYINTNPAYPFFSYIENYVQQHYQQHNDNDDKKAAILQKPFKTSMVHLF